MLRQEDLRGLQDPDSTSPIQENYISNEGENGEKSGDRTISVARPQTAAVPETSAKPAAKTQPVQPAAKKTPVPEQAPASVAPAKQTYHDFWVQAGSYSSRERADGVKQSLSDKGITAIITNQQINSQTYYRVRIGPYTSQNEADYWLAMIKSIDGFGDSQIWESQSKR
jgi:DedD protein